jgi:hypothetical protein
MKFIFFKFYFIFRNGSIAPGLASKGCTHLFFIRLFSKPYKRNIKIKLKAIFLVTTGQTYKRDEGGDEETGPVP